MLYYHRCLGELLRSSTRSCAPVCRGGRRVGGQGGQGLQRRRALDLAAVVGSIRRKYVTPSPPTMSVLFLLATAAAVSGASTLGALSSTITSAPSATATAAAVTVSGTSPLPLTDYKYTYPNLVSPELDRIVLTDAAPARSVSCAALPRPTRGPCRLSPRRGGPRARRLFSDRVLTLAVNPFPIGRGPQSGYSTSPSHPDPLTLRRHLQQRHRRTQLAVSDAHCQRSVSTSLQRTRLTRTDITGQSQRRIQRRDSDEQRRLLPLGLA